MGVYNKSGNALQSIFGRDGSGLAIAYEKNGNVVFPSALPVPTGNLTASSVVPLPDIHGNGHGWTCTGLAYDASSNTFLVGDIGKALPSSSGFASQIVRVSFNFQTVIETIPLYTSFPNMQDVQGITIDTSDGTIWFCSTSENLIRHIRADGTSIGSFSVSGRPTGIAYSPLEQYTFAYSDTLDQCFLDPEHGYLYIVAGANYSSRNNVYLFDTATQEQSITCTVDSYSVEGLWIGPTEMVIVNDGYYHSAVVAVNQANIYDVST